MKVLKKVLEVCVKVQLLFVLALFALLLPRLSAAAGNEGSNRVITVDATQAKQLHEAGAVFIDVRSSEEWQLGHIKNALHIEFNTDFERIKRMEGINKDTPLVIYCSSSECQTGALASAVSLFWGFSKVFYFADGYFSWILKDYPAVMNTEAQFLQAEN